jgi:hypothetical protein
MSSHEKWKLRPHPLVAALARAGVDQRDAVVLVGCVGEAAPEGRVRLYLSLSDLSMYVEFDEDAILHSHELGESGVTTVWVDARTSVTAVRTLAGSARNVAAAIGSASSRSRRHRA